MHMRVPAKCPGRELGAQRTAFQAKICPTVTQPWADFIVSSKKQGMLSHWVSRVASLGLLLPQEFNGLLVAL